MASLVGVELEQGGVLLKLTRTAAESGGEVHVQEARSTRPPLRRHSGRDPLGISRRISTGEATAAGSAAGVRLPGSIRARQPASWRLLSRTIGRFSS